MVKFSFQGSFAKIDIRLVMQIHIYFHMYRFGYWIFSKNNKKQCIFAKINGYNFRKSLWEDFGFLLKLFPKTVVLIKITFLCSYFLQKFDLQLFNIESSRTLKGMEPSNSVSQKLINGKISSRPHLVPRTSRISSLLSENVTISWM